MSSPSASTSNILDSATEDAPSLRISSGTWATLGVVLLGFFAAVSAWLYRHNEERKPVDFWGFDSHRVLRDAPSIKATLIQPDPTRFTPNSSGEQLWHDNLFMMVERRFLVENRADVQDRPEFRLVVTNEAEIEKAKAIATDGTPRVVEPKFDDADREASLRRILRSNASYDWQAFPWAQDPEWRYALTIAKQETTNPGTKHELTRTFTFTLVFDVTCRWVTLQSVEKITALKPHAQERFKKFFLEVFPGSDVVAPLPPTATGTPTGGAGAASGPIADVPAAGPVGSGLSLGAGTMVTSENAPAPIGAPLTPTTESGSPLLQLNPGNPMLRSGAGQIPLDPLTPQGPALGPTLPTTTSPLQK